MTSVMTSVIKVMRYNHHHHLGFTSFFPCQTRVGWSITSNNNNNNINQTKFPINNWLIHEQLWQVLSWQVSSAPFKGCNHAVGGGMTYEIGSIIPYLHLSMTPFSYMISSPSASFDFIQTLIKQ